MKQPLKLTTRQGERIAVVAGLRTPFAKQATAFHGVPAVDLGKLVVSELLARTDLNPMLIDQLVFGQVVQMPEAPNIAREIVLGTGMSVTTDAYSVSRACATSFQAVANVTESIMAGTVDIAIAGGADSSSVLPIGVSKTLARALVDLNKARNLQQRFNILRQLRVKDLLPVPPAVAEYSTGLSMGRRPSRWPRATRSAARHKMRWLTAPTPWPRRPGQMASSMARCLPPMYRPTSHRWSGTTTSVKAPISRATPSSSRCLTGSMAQSLRLTPPRLPMAPPPCC